mgnify:FL=1
MASVISRTTPRASQSRSAVSSVFEQDGQVTILLEMPGISTENLDVRIEESKLIIHGKAPASDEGTYHLRERNRSDFHMVFTVDETVDRDKVEAVLKNGMLRVLLERKESEKPRKIKIKTG